MNLSDSLTSVKLFKNQKNQLIPIEKDSFKLEKEIQELVEKNLETLFGLEFVSTEFKVGEFRIDTLAFDEATNSFVIIEYKKGSSYSVVDQGYSYLSTMINNKADFVLEYSEKKGEMLKRESVDWSSSKVVFVAPTFTAYQRNSINFGDIPFELWEVRRFAGSIFAFERVLATSDESIEKINNKKKNTMISKVSSEIKTPKIADHESKLDSETKLMWEALKERILSLGGIEIKANKHYLAFAKEQANLCIAHLLKSSVSVTIRRGILNSNKPESKHLFSLDDPKKVAKIIQVTQKNGKVYCEYKIKFRNLEEIDYLMFLIEQKNKIF